DELMSLLDRDGAAPVLAEMHARPNCEKQATSSQQCATPKRPFRRQQKPLAEKIDPHISYAQQKHGDCERNDVQEPGWQGLAPHGALDIARCGPPVDHPAEPHRSEGVAVDKRHSQSEWDR